MPAEPLQFPAPAPVEDPQTLALRRLIPNWYVADRMLNAMARLASRQQIRLSLAELSQINRQLSPDCRGDRPIDDSDRRLLANAMRRI